VFGADRDVSRLVFFQQKYFVGAGNAAVPDTTTPVLGAVMMQLQR